jgi:hypothetical protein
MTTTNHNEMTAEEYLQKHLEFVTMDGGNVMTEDQIREYAHLVVAETLEKAGSELKRYEPMTKLNNFTNDDWYAGMDESLHGEYVKLSEASALIAKYKAELAEANNRLHELSELNIGLSYKLDLSQQENERLKEA